MVPDDGIRASEIRAAIPAAKWHRWFGSLKSSQALTQSVFGALGTFDRLDLLNSVPAECGRPAFFGRYSGWTLDLEHDVRELNEPRPTNVDVIFRAPGNRVAVECKFTERDFGSCSRPNLRPNDSRYAKQYCEGNYRVQHGRRERCSLTEIGIRYWEYLPQLFNWPADRDHVPCPFRDVYQLARNALAAAVKPDGALDTDSGHVLLVYDANNPEFQPGGKAELQWQAANSACRVEGLLRRLSWQRLLKALSGASELSYLVDGAGRKYGLKAE